jgi:hypothetical protein
VSSLHPARPFGLDLRRHHRRGRHPPPWSSFCRASRVSRGGRGAPGPPPAPPAGYADETKARLAAGARARTRISYEYDFGDGWEHDLVVEARAVAEAGQVYPACIAGEGGCPPEDSGGAYSFGELKEVLAGPPSPERDELREWAGDTYDPARFDLAAANAAVAAV